MTKLTKLLPTALLLAGGMLIACFTVFMYLYGPRSAWNIGDIVVHDYKNNLMRIPTYADSLELQARWLDKLESDNPDIYLDEMKLYSEAVIERLTDIQVGLAEVQK